MSTSYLQRGRGRIAYDVQGEGPLVVCLPGMGDIRALYRFLTPALVDAGYRVATMDLRGHGDSDDGFDSFDDVAAATDALALIEHLGGSAVLIGNSMGAGASVWAAAEDPAKVRALVLVGAFVRNPKTNPVMARLQRALLWKPWGPAALRSYYRGMYPGRPPADLPAYQSRISRYMRTGDHWRSFIKTPHTSHTPVEARLDGVSTPNLTVMGDKDGDFADPPAEAKFIAERLHGEHVLVPGAGHYPVAEYPEIVNPSIVDFLNRVHARA